jgi:orotate phosphoribosyltransferase
MDLKPKLTLRLHFVYLIRVDNLKTKLIQLIRHHCLSYGNANQAYTLASGLSSHYYIDIKKLTLSTSALYIAVMLDEQLRQLISLGIDYEAIGGPETGANQIVGGYMVWLGSEPISNPTGYKMHQVRGFTVRKQSKDHGKGGMISGDLRADDRVVIVEDVTTLGGSVLEAIHTVETIGATVVAVISILDREQGAENLLKALGIRFIPLVKLSELGIVPRLPGVNCPI